MTQMVQKRLESPEPKKVSVIQKVERTGFLTLTRKVKAMGGSMSTEMYGFQLGTPLA